MNEVKTRSSYWDNIKGILIFLTVFAHILFQLQDSSAAINSTVDYIYMFHMPVFVFVSGFFGKSERAHSFEAVIRLGFLYFIFNSIMGFIYGFNSLLEPVYSYWYLIALIVWRLTAHYIASFKETKLILFTISLFAGFYPSINNTFAAARIIGFYPYYMAGYLLTFEQSRELSEKKGAKRLGAGILNLTGAGVLSFCSYQYFNYSDNALQMAAYSEPLDAFGRIVLYIIAFWVIYALRCISPNQKIPLVTMFGRNSIWIFLLHRPVTLIISQHIAGKSTGFIIIISTIASLLISILFGNDTAAKYLNKFADSGISMFTDRDVKKFNISKAAALCVALSFIVSVVINSYSGVSKEDLKKLMNGEYSEETEPETVSDDIIYPIMTKQQKENFDNAFRITFSGDLILLEDQVKRAYNGIAYDFSDVFEYSEKYIASADLAIGVFEGPMAGEEAGYTSGNFDDQKELYLNFPDSFATAVKNAGFDLVTTANNHVLDKGVEGAERTIEILDKTGLDHTGSYRSEKEKINKHIKLIECEKIKIAVLSYTYGSNYVKTSELTEGSLSYLTSVISGTEGEQFERLKADVEQDFKAAKALSPDLIIVLPHIGTQFSNEPDEEQKVWFDIFKENGADIILGDHPHVVEPALIEEYQGRNVFTAYCPGNFANIYRKNQGDTSVLIDVYIDRTTKQVIGGGIVPLYTQSPADGNYRTLPIYDIMNDKNLRTQLSTDDIERAKNANNLITDVIFGHEMDITAVTEKYYFDKNGFIRSKTAGLALTDEMKNGILYKQLEAADSICFIGDSVTEGTKNGGCPWYEPIEEYLDNKNIFNYSKGGCTVSYMVNRTEEIPEADLYVIALGTNDVRYRDKSICAMTAESYVSEINTLKDKLKEKNNSAEFVLIAPWYSTDGDPFCPLSYSDKTNLNDEYSAALENYCNENNLNFINANQYIRNTLKVNPDSEYLLDHIHPNSSCGVLLYTKAVLLN